jgi:hypothetical protein
MKIALNLMLLSILVWACDQSSEKEPARNALSKQQAQAYIQRYKKLVLDTTEAGREWRAKYLNYAQGFTISSGELLQAMGCPLKDTAMVKFQNVRLYVGIDDLLNLRAFITPVLGANTFSSTIGKDTILSGPYMRSVWSPDSVVGDEPAMDGPYVFDFTMPCPNSCAEDSPLLQIDPDQN